MATVGLRVEPLVPRRHDAVHRREHLAPAKSGARSWTSSAAGRQAREACRRSTSRPSSGRTGRESSGRRRSAGGTAAACGRRRRSCRRARSSASAQRQRRLLERQTLDAEEVRDERGIRGRARARRAAPPVWSPSSCDRKIQRTSSGSTTEKTFSSHSSRCTGAPVSTMTGSAPRMTIEFTGRRRSPAGAEVRDQERLGGDEHEARSPERRFPFQTPLHRWGCSSHDDDAPARALSRAAAVPQQAAFPQMRDVESQSPRRYGFPMKAGERVQRAVAAVERASATSASADELLERVAGELRTYIPHDASMVFGIDPVTMIATEPSRIEGWTPPCATPSGTSSSTSRTPPCSPISPAASRSPRCASRSAIARAQHPLPRLHASAGLRRRAARRAPDRPPHVGRASASTATRVHAPFGEEDLEIVRSIGDPVARALRT